MGWDTIVVCDPGVPEAKQNQAGGDMTDIRQGQCSVLRGVATIPQDRFVYTAWGMGLVPT